MKVTIWVLQESETEGERIRTFVVEAEFKKALAERMGLPDVPENVVVLFDRWKAVQKDVSGDLYQWYTESHDIPVTPPEANQLEFSYIVLQANKRREKDHYDNGCAMYAPDTVVFSAPRVHYASLSDAFLEVFGIKAHATDIMTMDNNIYQDYKGEDAKGYPITQIVVNSHARGRYRVIFDRQENKQGRIPSSDYVERWKKHEVEMFSTCYELVFQILVTGLEEESLSNVLGLTHHP